MLNQPGNFVYNNKILEKKIDTALQALSTALQSRCFPVAPPLQYLEVKRSLINIYN